MSGSRRASNYQFRQLSSVSLDNDQLDARLLYFTIRPLQSSTCFKHYMLTNRRLNYIDAASGIVTLSKWPSGARVEIVLSQSFERAPRRNEHAARNYSNIYYKNTYCIMTDLQHSSHALVLCKLVR